MLGTLLVGAGGGRMLLIAGFIPNYTTLICGCVQSSKLFFVTVRYAHPRLVTQVGFFVLIDSPVVA